MTKLQSLQSIVELNEFLKFIDSNHVYTSDLHDKIDSMISVWSNLMPNLYSDPPSTWDDIITNRCIYLEYIEDKYYGTGNANSVGEVSMYDYSIVDNSDAIDEKRKVLKKIEKIKIKMQINFAQAAQYQGKFQTQMFQNQLIVKI